MREPQRPWVVQCSVRYHVGGLLYQYVSEIALARGRFMRSFRESLILVACALAGLALLIATIGAGLALLTGHARWIELAWLSIAGSLFVLVLRRLWPSEP